MIAALATVHPSVQRQVAEWLDEAAREAADPALGHSPYLATAFASLAKCVLQLEGANPKASRPESEIA